MDNGDAFRKCQLADTSDSPHNQKNNDVITTIYILSVIKSFVFSFVLTMINHRLCINATLLQSPFKSQ